MLDQENGIKRVLSETPTKRDELIEQLQEELTAERDARREERFIFIVLVVILFDIVFFTVMSNISGPIAILILQLLILIPLARRMGMQEIAQSLDNVLSRIAGKTTNAE